MTYKITVRNNVFHKFIFLVLRPFWIVKFHHNSNQIPCILISLSLFVSSHRNACECPPSTAPALRCIFARWSVHRRCAGSLLSSLLSFFCCISQFLKFGGENLGQEQLSQGKFYVAPLPLLRNPISSALRPVKSRYLPKFLFIPQSTPFF